MGTVQINGRTFEGDNINVVGGDVHAGGSVNCDSVGGNVKAGGSVMRS